MKRSDLFNKILYSQYFKAGIDVDYNIEVDHNNSIVLIMFQGTANKTDVITDLKFPVKAYKKQKSCLLGHGGFIEAWKSSNDFIMNEFIRTTEQYKDYRPLITGHSLGGAMAVLCAEDFFYRTGRKADLITFGCPNVLFGKKSRNYVFSCCGIIEQYAQYNDLVPTVPLFYKQLNKIKCGEKFNLFKFLFHTADYHCSYNKLDI